MTRIGSARKRAGMFSRVFMKAHQLFAFAAVLLAGLTRAVTTQA